MTANVIDRLRAVNPLPDGADVPAEWREAVLARVTAQPDPDVSSMPQRRTVLVLVAAVVVALLAIPSYGVARDIVQWVRGEPAPQAIVNEFESYAPQLGYQPDPGGAILVAVEGGDVRLYSTKNDKGSYCLALTAPGRPSGDGGTCINPDWADEPLIAGTLGATAGDDQASTQFIAGRTTTTEAHSIRFDSPDGTPIEPSVGYDGFFVASVRVPRAACGAGDWRPTFLVLDADGREVARADITLLHTLPAQGACGFTPPHPPQVK